MKGFSLNIIFDLGGVVITWDPDAFVADVFTDKEIQKIARKHILDHSDWIEMDRGTLTIKEAIKRGVERTGLPESEVKRLLQAVPLFLTPIKESLQLVYDLKKADHKLFVLSNLHPESIAHLEKEFSFLELFDGRVISCRINKVKPEAEIYHHLISTYQLDVADTVFIDDFDINLEAANAIGLKTIKFEDADQCKRELEKLGCLE
jgi:putative hydrolase of the HAD superfamily